MATVSLPRLTPQELQERIARGEAIVTLDVRSEDARRVHPHQIAGARWIALAVVVQQAATLPRDHLIATY